jgi:hypothetical protein
LEINPEKKKLIVFASHDLNMWALLLGLKYELKDRPQFCDNITLQYYKDEKNLGKGVVRIFYQGKRIDEEIAKLNNIQLENEFSGIPIKSFVSLLKKEMFSNMDEFMENCLI